MTRGVGVFHKLFDNWEQQFLRPILLTVLTTAVLFAGSLLLKPVRSFFFPPQPAGNYPLQCTAEPYLDASGEVLLVDFFIMNRTDTEYSRDDLKTILRTANPDPESGWSPDIRLSYTRLVDGKPLGEVARALADQEFNGGKGDLQVSAAADSVSIKVNRIARRAIMRVTIGVAGVPDLRDSAVVRTAKGMVPFDFQRYEDSCYSRP